MSRSLVNYFVTATIELFTYRYYVSVLVLRSYFNEALRSCVYY
jgi:hypothetical protein